MKGKVSKGLSLKRILRSGFCASLLVAGSVGYAAAIEGLKPLSPQPAVDTVKPGLGVVYYGAKLDSIRQFIEWMDYEKGTPGTPIPMLNYQVGQGNILTATTTDLIGADIKGMINFDKVGTYIMMVHSNDGVRVTIGGVMIHEDPDVHADRFSEEIKLEISEPGWYPVHILYFEKKNTATLELYWDPPGPEEIDYVPASAFGHIGNE